MEDENRFELHIKKIFRVPLLILQPILLLIWPLSLLSNPLIANPFQSHHLGVMALMVATTALLFLARSALMMSLAFAGNICMIAFAFRVQIDDSGPLGFYWNLPIAVLITLGTCGMTYRVSAYLATLVGVWFILFAGEPGLAPEAMPWQLTWIMVGVTLAIGIAYNVVNSHWMRRTFALKERYRLLAETDPLTGIANRRKLLQQLETTLSLSPQPPGYFVMFDIDDFKAINDRHGHQAGDDVLMALARELGRLDPALQVGRLGGEEFGALALAMGEDQLKDLLAELQLRMAQDERQRVTFSAGVARLQPGEALGEPLRRADENLYLAKRQGKDQVVWPR